MKVTFTGRRLEVSDLGECPYTSELLDRHLQKGMVIHQDEDVVRLIWVESGKAPINESNIRAA